MLAGLVLLTPSVRAEPVEARSLQSRPSTRSGRAERKEQVETVIEAEGAFAADAQEFGQWTAFRKWAAANATMFVPRPTNAQAWLKGRANPARAIEWWPTAAWVSCDGTLAVDTGGWRRPDGSSGYFTTIWAKQKDGQWRWLVDHGDVATIGKPAPAPLPDQPVTRSASCATTGLSVAAAPMVLATAAAGLSRDGTLIWQWSFKRGVRQLSVQMWNGRDYERVVSDQVLAAQP